MTDTSLTKLRFYRLLLTGAGGGLGVQLRLRLKRYCRVLRLSDLPGVPLGEEADGEEIKLCDLQDAANVMEMVRDVDAIIHMGGVSTEQPWSTIFPANVMGVINLYEAARLAAIPRIIFASSNHVMGFYRQNEVVDCKSPPRPDGFYGLSKAFGENVAQMYWDRWGIETVSVRIGSSFPEPKDRRMLSTWLSYDDLERLVVAGLMAPVVGHTIIYGTSDNSSSWYDNRLASHIGFRPMDSSEQYRKNLEDSQPVLDHKDPSVQYQGGAFVKISPNS